MRKLILRIVVVSVVIVAGAVGAFAWWRQAQEDAFLARVQALREAGEPVEMLDLPHAPASDEVNGVRFLIEARDWLDRDPTIHELEGLLAENLPELREDRTEEHWNVVARWIEAHGPFVDLLREVVARPRCRSHDVAECPLDIDASPIRVLVEATNMLGEDTLLRSRNGESTEVVLEPLVLLLDLAQRVEVRQLLDLIARTNVNLRVGETLEEIARREGFDARLARSVVGCRLEAIEDRAVLRDALRHEQLLGLWFFRHPERFESARTGTGDVEGGFPGTWIGRAFVWRNAIPYLDAMEACIRAADRPEHEIPAAISAAFPRPAEGWDRLCSLTGMVDLGIELGIGSRQAAIAEVRLARIGLALLEHRQETGAWPDRLDAIADRMPEGLPPDPFTGEPFRYEATDEGIRLESGGRPSTVAAGEELETFGWSLPGR